MKAHVELLWGRMDLERGLFETGQILSRLLLSKMSRLIYSVRIFRGILMMEMRVDSQRVLLEVVRFFFWAVWMPFLPYCKSGALHLVGIIRKYQDISNQDIKKAFIHMSDFPHLAYFPIHSTGGIMRHFFTFAMSLWFDGSCTHSYMWEVAFTVLGWLNQTPNMILNVLLVKSCVLLSHIWVSEDNIIMGLTKPAYKRNYCLQLLLPLSHNDDY